MKVLFALSGSTLIAFGGIFTYLFGRLFTLFFSAGSEGVQADLAARVLMVAVVVGGGLAVLLCAIGGITQLLKLAKFAVILSADSIRFQSPFGSTTLAFDQILAKRSRVTTGRFGDSYTVLIPKDEKHLQPRHLLRLRLRRGLHPLARVPPRHGPQSLIPARLAAGPSRS